MTASHTAKSRKDKGIPMTVTIRSNTINGKVIIARNPIPMDCHSFWVRISFFRNILRGKNFKTRRPIISDDTNENNISA
ncbi:hypothetical protein COV53_02940 [Candidatus Gottesmanbacteria bacterium CG11_big_fil_rev_8_21_14_0_20_37_11]|uniref:Uncharacterized protein n=1 Tax=Candidatus Gottesmanbacteria bacterium CG11_big_fil_rev_8_21_14_0_20_37_11 TaxID=1974575 RepID=A0A2H0NJR7_9BACT|nr:MAG: hypothetical protein COV53_02940 [Candidatus Gottesmanbacteria bacterium CG11_big_fil_rev_8_21_14_0_20_37_11]